MLKLGQEMSFGKLKILFINIFAILYKATALNVHRLHSNLRQVKVVVNTSGTEELWSSEVLSTLISGLIVMRFILCFIGLASNIVAMLVGSFRVKPNDIPFFVSSYPLLTNSQPELLMPTIIVQIIDNIFLNIYEIVLGYACIKYLYPESYAVFVIFLAKMMIKTICCVSML